MQSSNQECRVVRAFGFVLAAGLALALCLPAPAQNQSASNSLQRPAAPDDASTAADDSLQKAGQNPVANLISVPLQNNTNFSYGPYNRTQDVLNIQPVIPANISQNWMVVYSRHPANHLAALSWAEHERPIRIGGHGPDILFVTPQSGQADLGCRAVCAAIPCLRHSSGVATPASDSFKMAMICSSLNRLLRTTPPPGLGGHGKSQKSHFGWTNFWEAGQTLSC